MTVGIIALPLAIDFGIASGDDSARRALDRHYCQASRWRSSARRVFRSPVRRELSCRSSLDRRPPCDNGLALARLIAGALVVGVALVVLIPFLRRLITDKAEVSPEDMETTTAFPV